VQVNPAQTTAEPPKNAKYYSDKHSQAANRKADRETNLPKIAGEQDRVIKTEDVVPEKFEPLRPTPPVAQAQQAPQDEEEAKAAPDLKSGELELGKPAPNPQPDEGTAKKTKPRTIAAALARKGQTELPGRKMKQDGGVKGHIDIDALDAKATPFGAYDSAFVAYVDKRWRTLLYDRDYATFTSGKVVLQFRLHYDGRISDMRVAENTAGEVLGLICQKAVLDPAPYPVWPSDLRRMAGDTRSIQFTFHYN
jgi:outer membrane biosynthesis protein TonB